MKKYYFLPKALVERKEIKEKLDQIQDLRYFEETEEYLDDKEIIPYQGVTEKEKEIIRKGESPYFEGVVVEAEEDLYRIIRNEML